MRKLLKTKEEKIEFIINKLDYLVGLEFIDNDEISAVRLAQRRLKKSIKS